MKFPLFIFIELKTNLFDLVFSSCIFFLSTFCTRHAAELSYFIVCIYADDLSNDKVATQSTTYPHGSNVPYTYAAGNVVDRNKTTCMRTLPVGQNSPDKTVWWKVDLGGVYSIYSVNILFKNYPGYGMY